MATPGPDSRNVDAHSGWLRAVLIAGAMIALIGVLLFIWDASQPRSFGWFAYAPLQTSTLPPTGSFGPFGPSVAAAWGGLLTGLGFVLIAFWAGATVGRRLQQP
ncbi:hypothetical protein [Herbiconiux sp. L3-i23]|uniref:hypothetical protein n=1 Tax=Herbiconiux sp. L3-i23 TaxID=2905871 RepID=UPI00206836DF|nr:hypothetical protein [Herbiconiux sp. L3-i23]BDI23191.1 hypothetical protein L3i23_19670 [Herbiconiux sp. L3-i23]